jgi:hypothetical protein
MAMPTPFGVPVIRMSPGSSVSKHINNDMTFNETCSPLETHLINGDSL